MDNSADGRGPADLRPVSQLLLSISYEESRHHNLKHYARAMKGHAQKARRLLHVGGDSISFLLESGHVLKVTNRALEPDLGARWFDMPILERGRKGAGEQCVYFFEQPFGEPVSGEQADAFMKELAARGWWIVDPGQRQIRLYVPEQRPTLVDPWAVVPWPASHRQPQQNSSAGEIEDEQRERHEPERSR